MTIPDPFKIGNGWRLKLGDSIASMIDFVFVFAFDTPLCLVRHSWESNSLFLTSAALITSNFQAFLCMAAISSHPLLISQAAITFLMYFAHPSFMLSSVIRASFTNWSLLHSLCIYHVIIMINKETLSYPKLFGPRKTDPSGQKLSK